jgi:Fe-S-cluster containining protein
MVLPRWLWSFERHAMTPLEEAQARMADPTLFPKAEERLKVINKRLAASDVQRYADQIAKPISTARKVIFLKQAINVLIEATKGISPCAEGCAHCCHMATFITVREAEELAKASGRKMQTPDVYDAPDAIERYQGIPCTFLKDNRCTVYNNRPIACRIHISVDRDNLLCKIIPGEEIRTPTVNTERYNLLHLTTYKNPTEICFADIRQFFPPENP